LHILINLFLFFVRQIALMKLKTVGCQKVGNYYVIYPLHMFHILCQLLYHEDHQMSNCKIVNNASERLQFRS